MPSRLKPTIRLFVPETWLTEVEGAVHGVLPGEVVSRLREVPGEDMFHDTMDYVGDAYTDVGGGFPDETRAKLVSAVLRRFGFFRSYHGCRPFSLESFQREGLLPLTRERLAGIAFELFEGTIARDEIVRHANAAKLKTRLGQTYFTADEEYLVTRCGHYLIYGAESLCNLWRDKHERPLPQFRESQERHRTRGIPAVFECDVPLRWIPAIYRTELANAKVTHYFQLQSRQPVPLRQWSRNWGYSIRRDLPPQYLIRHSHPEAIPDPLQRGMLYRNNRRQCAWCPPAVLAGVAESAS